MKVMEKLKKWAREANLIQSATLFGVTHDNPQTTLPAHCRFDACMVISKDATLNDSIYEGELIGGKYLIYTIKHTAEDIQNAYPNIFLCLQYQIDHKPILERYTGDIIDNPYCEICVPVIT